MYRGLTPYCSRFPDQRQAIASRGLLPGDRSRELASKLATADIRTIETLRQFFGFCKERNWTDDNPAKRIKSAKNIKTAEVVPYTPDQLTCIIAACDGIGKAPYERRKETLAEVTPFQPRAL
jgi:site-specific recombinase XerD